MAQANSPLLPQKFETLIKYSQPHPDDNHSLSIVAFAASSHLHSGSQLCYVFGLIIGKIQQGSIFHLFSWASHKSRRLVQSTSAAEILAAGEAVKEVVFIRRALEAVYNISPLLAIFVDAKHLYSSLSSQRNAMNKSVCGDLNSIQKFSLHIYSHSICLHLLKCIQSILLHLTREQTPICTRILNISRCFPHATHLSLQFCLF